MGLGDEYSDTGPNGRMQDIPAIRERRTIQIRSKLSALVVTMPSVVRLGDPLAIQIEDHFLETVSHSAQAMPLTAVAACPTPTSTTGWCAKPRLEGSRHSGRSMGCGNDGALLRMAQKAMAPGGS